jgi:hypothetical protein
VIGAWPHREMREAIFRGVVALCEMAVNHARDRRA